MISGQLHMGCPAPRHIRETWDERSRHPVYQTDSSPPKMLPTVIIDPLSLCIPTPQLGRTHNKFKLL
jgi:hypothetical protein